MEQVTVNKYALHQVLDALTGPGHLIRELQITSRLAGPDIGFDDPINTLISQYNEQAEGGRVVFDLVAHLRRQISFSVTTFGPGERAAACCDHIRKELDEIAANPTDLTEWVDIVLLALDGAWRAGNGPEAIAQAIAAKQTKNESRQWPDWRTAEPGKAIEHIRA
ncbi:MAG: dATP/dGTP pyrophosphohydrolase domain-containing protein [Pseudomonadota bacterium]